MVEQETVQNVSIHKKYNGKKAEESSFKQGSYLLLLEVNLKVYLQDFTNICVVASQLYGGGKR